MASKKRKRTGGFFLLSAVKSFSTITVWRDCRKAQAVIISKAVDAAMQTEAYRQLEIEKRVAFGVMAFTVAFPLIALSVVVLIATFWKG